MGKKEKKRKIKRVRPFNEEKGREGESMSCKISLK
jgi:hypothetical protein